MDVLLVRVADMLFGDGMLQFDDVRARASLSLNPANFRMVATCL
jgi:hypothetical protein